jgi:hypothetical protein
MDNNAMRTGPSIFTPRFLKSFNNPKKYAMHILITNPYTTENLFMFFSGLTVFNPLTLTTPDLNEVE